MSGLPQLMCKARCGSGGTTSLGLGGIGRRPITRWAEPFVSGTRERLISLPKTCLPDGCLRTRPNEKASKRRCEDGQGHCDVRRQWIGQEHIRPLASCPQPVRRQIVGADDFFEGSEGYRFDKTKLAEAHGQCFRRFIDFLDVDVDLVIVDNTNTTTEEIAPYMLGASAYGYEAEVITIEVKLKIGKVWLDAPSLIAVAFTLVLPRYDPTSDEKHCRSADAPLVDPADFRWRCIHSDNPAANRFATPDCRALSAVRATKWTGEETAFARTGRQAPRFVAEPKDARITEDESARFTAKAEGVPNPTYQWFLVDRANNGQILSGETNPELAVSNPALGVTRYVVSATNSAGDAQSRVASLSVEQKLKLAQARVDAGSRATAKPAHYNVKSEEDIERQRRRLQAEKAQEIFQKRSAPK